MKDKFDINFTLNKANSCFRFDIDDKTFHNQILDPFRSNFVEHVSTFFNSIDSARRTTQELFDFAVEDLRRRYQFVAQYYDSYHSATIRSTVLRISQQKSQLFALVSHISCTMFFQVSTTNEPVHYRVSKFSKVPKKSSQLKRSLQYARIFLI